MAQTYVGEPCCIGHFLSARALLCCDACRSQATYFLHAREIGWFGQFSRIIQSEQPFREFDGPGRQRKIADSPGFLRNN
jgi:hypothetical protein